MPCVYGVSFFFVASDECYSYNYKDQPMLLDEFYRKHAVRKHSELPSGRLSSLKDFQLPYYSMIHYVPTVADEIGIDPQHPILVTNEQDILVTHITRQDTPMGSVRTLNTNTDVLVKQYHKRYIAIKRLRNIDTALRNKSNPIVVNHAISTQVNQYRRTPMSGYHESYNLLYTLWNTVDTYSESPMWIHWLPMELPKNLPTIETLKKVEDEVTRTLVTEFDEVPELMILELWRFAKGLDSVLDLVTEENRSKVHVTWWESGKWGWLRVSDLYSWREDLKGDAFAKAIYRFFEALFEARTPMGSDIALDDDPSDDVLSGTSETALTKTILDQADKLMAVGRMSTAEYRRIQRLSVKYRTLPAPDGEGTLAEHLNISSEDLSVTAAVIPDISSVTDKSMLKSTLIDFNRTYISKVLSKDISNMAVAVQHAGIAVTGFSKEEHTDIAGSTVVYTLKLQPVDGVASTVKFTLPKVAENGVYRVNNVKYRMAAQPSSLPITKIKPNRVALTSYYGKSFVTRSERTVDDYSAWIVKRIIASTVESNSSYTKVRYGAFNDPLNSVPLTYSGISSRLAGFTHNSIAWNFDYSVRESLYGVDTLKRLERNDLVVCGQRGKTYYLMDLTDTVYTFDTKLTAIGPLETILGLTGRVPVDHANIGVFGKELPVGMVLGYYYGLDKLLKMLRVKTRVVAKGTRVVLQDDEFGIVFKDETLIIPRTDKTAAMVLSGFNSYAKQIKEVPMHAFNKPDVYNAVLTRPNLRATRFLKEIDLMFTMFIDHITLELLQEMKEPTELGRLMIRACELLTTSDHPDEVDPEFLRYRGYERMAGMVYTELVASIRKYRSKPSGSGAKIDMNPYAVAMAIQKDASVALVEESNPIHNLKEQELVTHSGAGGRSSRAMNRSARMYHRNNIGTISEATVDSSKVAVNVSFSANPKLTSLRGQTSRFDSKEDSLTNVLSTSAVLSPFADRDTSKRINFISIQHDSAVGCENYRPQPVTTGYEKVVAHRADDLYAYTASFAGKVVDISDDTVLLVDAKSGEETAVEIGTIHGVVSGINVPHRVICDMSVNQRFQKGDVIAFNTGFFQRDFFDPMQVQWKAGMMVNTVLIESSETWEDSSSISSRIAKELSTSITSVRAISVPFDQNIHDLLKVGDVVDENTVLCVLEDDVIDDGSLFDSKALSTLDGLAAKAPKAKSSGTIDRIEVMYFGEVDDMTESLQRVAKDSDRILKGKAKRLGGDRGNSGQVRNAMRVGGVPLTKNNAVVKVYITKVYESGNGEKAVFGNALKTVFGSIMTGTNETESGIQLDAKFSQDGVDARVVNSPALMGTSNMLMTVMTNRIVDMYFKQ